MSNIEDDDDEVQYVGSYPRLIKVTASSQNTKNKYENLKLSICDEEEVLFIEEVVKTSITTTKVVNRPIEYKSCSNKQEKREVPLKNRRTKKSKIASKVSLPFLPHPTDPLSKLRDTIYSVLTFTPNNVLIPSDCLTSRNKILGSRDQLTEWILHCKQNENLKVVQFHFQAIESILNALIEDHKESNTSVLHSLYSTSVMNLCVCVESYSKDMKEKTTTGAMANLLEFPNWIVRSRNKLAHANADKPGLMELNRAVAVALHWLKKYFFANLNLLVTQNGQAFLEYNINFPKAKLKSTSRELVTIPGSSTVMTNDENSMLALNGNKSNETVRSRQTNRSGKRTREDCGGDTNQRAPLKTHSGPSLGGPPFHRDRPNNAPWKPFNSTPPVLDFPLESQFGQYFSSYEPNNKRRKY